MVAVGGERSDLFLRSIDPKVRWGVHLSVGRSIVKCVLGYFSTLAPCV